MTLLNRSQTVVQRMWKMMTVSQPAYVLKIIVMDTRVMRKRELIETDLQQDDHRELLLDDLQGLNQQQDANHSTN